MRNHPAHSLTLLIATAAVSIFLAACGGGGGGSSAGGAAINAVTLTYPSGRIMATGTFESGTTTRSGEWKEYFDQDGSPQQWRKTYVTGSWDHAQDWREWNADGSIRNDRADH